MYKKGMVFGVVLALVLGSSSLCPAQWKKSVVDTVGSDPSPGSNPSLAMDRGGLPHLSYFVPDYDYPPSLGRNTLKHAFFDGKKWHSEPVELCDGAGYSSIVLDSTDGIHIVYLLPNVYVPGVFSNGTLRHAIFDGKSWIFYNIDEESSWIPPSLTIDADDNLHVSYSYSPMRYAKSDGFNFINEVFTDVLMNPEGTSIAVSASGIVDIMISQGFYWGDTHDPTTYWARKNSTSWDLARVELGAYSSFTWDKSGNPHVAYYSEATKQIVYAAYSPDQGWLRQTVVDMADQPPFPLGIPPHPVIALSPDNSPHICFNLRQNQEHTYLVYAHRSATAWNHEVVAEIGDHHAAIAIDPSGILHLVYSGSYGSNKLLHARRQVYFPPPDLTGEWKSIVLNTGQKNLSLRGLLNLTDASGEAGQFLVSFYLSDDGTVDQTDLLIGSKPISRMKPGQSRILPITYSASTAASLAGKYLIAVIDSGNSASESNEGNNTAVGQIQ